jgi:hypothetical protein
MADEPAGELLDKQVDRLYGLPLDEFTEARNRLASQLRKAGDREAADRVKGLAKPTVSAWVVNRLARERAADVRSLLEAGDEVRAAQERALGGAGPEALRDAAQTERKAVRKLADEARELLAESGRPATDATIDRVSSTLHAAAVDDEGRRLLESGRLTDDLEAVGFGGLAGLAAAAPPPAPAKSLDRRREAAEAKRRLRELRAEASELERASEKAERDAAKAERAADEAREEFQRARAQADEAAALVSEAEAALADLEDA